MANDRNFVLGSGDLYVMEYTGTIPENAEIETEENRYGYVSGGATLAYKPEYVTVQDDLGYVKENVLKAEEVTFKSGLLHKCANFIPRVCPTARETADTEKLTTRVGGVKNDTGKIYLVRFVGASRSKGIRVTVVGTCTSGFEMAFAPDKETVIDTEFAAQPLDDTGTLALVEDVAGKRGETPAPAVLKSK